MEEMRLAESSRSVAAGGLPLSSLHAFLPPFSILQCGTFIYSVSQTRSLKQFVEEARSREIQKKGSEEQRQELWNRK